MEKKSCADETASQASLTFSLHHGRILRVALLQNVNLSANDLSSVLAISRHSNPDDKSSQIGSFAVLSTKYVVSISQLLVAANMALIREYNSLAGDRDSMYQEDGSEHFFNLKEESIGKRQPRTSKHVTSDVPIGNFSNRKSLRTVAMDTIYCAGGSLNKTAVMQDMGFCGNGAEKEAAEMFAIGFDCTAEQFYEFVTQVSGSPLPISSFQSRERSEEDKKDIMKAYSLSPQEVDPPNGSLECAIVTRIATKYLGK